MEQQEHNNVHHHQDENNNNDNCKNNNASPCLRQSSTRWTPTTDQIRILKELYYNNGVRSPTADQIQKISVRLRQYGKIEGKNVFYWFQNHKARERQKKRLFPDDPHFHQQNNMPTFMHQIPQDYSSNISKKYHNSLPSGISSSTSTSQALGVATFGYGSVTMEKSLRDCSMIAAGGASLNQNLGWPVGIDSSYSMTPYYARHHDQKKLLLNVNGGYYDEEDDDDDDQQGGSEIETLPLFPVHAENVNGFYNHQQSLSETGTGGCYYSGWCCSDNGYGGSRTSLELSLNSYGGQSS